MIKLFQNQNAGIARGTVQYYAFKIRKCFIQTTVNRPTNVATKLLCACMFSPLVGK